MSTVVSRQLGALLPPDCGLLLTLCSHRKSTLATCVTSLPYFILCPMCHPPKPPWAYYHVVASGSQPVGLGAQLPAFLTEFKSLFRQLM